MGGDTMADNFLISLRNDSGNGVPGTRVSAGRTPAYIWFQDTDKSYNLGQAIPSRVWLSYLPVTRVLVFVHGFDNDAGTVVDRHNTIKRHLPPDVNLISFDWPSGNTGAPEAKYFNDKVNAAIVAQSLMDCLAVIPNRGIRDISLLTHSMGAFVLEMAFLADQRAGLNHIFLAAADVDQSNYQPGSTILSNLQNSCSDLTVYWSQDDDALKDSQKLQGYVPLGLQGLPAPAPSGPFSIECTDYYRTYVKTPKPPVPAPEYSH